MTDIELAVSVYEAASREVVVGSGSGHEAGVRAVWTLARNCAYDDGARRVRDGYMCPCCGHRDVPDHSGVAGEPEATTENARCSKPAWVWLGSVAPPCGMPLDDRGRCSNPHPGSGPQIAVAATPTPVHPDTGSDSAAAVLAGAATVSAETVEVFKAAIPEERHGWLPYDEEIRVGLAAAARLIAAQALRSAARTLRTQIGSSWGIGDAVVHLLRRADELERGTDRG